MITILYGSNQLAVSSAVARLRQEFEMKQPDGVVYRFSNEDFAVERFDELISGGQLFGNPVLVIARNLWGDPKHQAWLETRLEAAMTSPTRFIFWEEGLEKSVASVVKKFGGMIREFTLKPGGLGKQVGFNIFSLTDALLKRHRRELWLRYMEVTYRGVPAEEVFWKLVWQVKILLWVSQTTEPIPELKPLVVSKARQAVGKFSLPELQGLSSNLLSLWHEAVSGEVDLALGLEQFILRL